MSQHSKPSVCSMSMSQVSPGKEGKPLQRALHTTSCGKRHFAALWIHPTFLPLTTEKSPVTKLLAELLRFTGTIIEHIHGMESLMAESLPSAKNTNKPL